MLHNIIDSYRQKIHEIMFRFSYFKVRYSFMRKISFDLKIINYCIRKLTKIGIPMNDKEYKVMKYLITAYDETIAVLDKCVEIYRKRTNEYDEINVVEK